MLAFLVNALIAFCARGCADKVQARARVRYPGAWEKDVCMSEAEERRDEISSLLSESGRMSVERLAAVFEVSPMTIRRDLAAMERAGDLRREHGAARLAGESDYGEKHSANAAQKRAIAEYCAGLVRPRDTLFLDAGTTTFEIATRILDVPGLIVVTDDIKIAFLLSQCTDFDVMVCGGTIQRETGSILGTFANQMLGYVQIDRAFLGAASINPRLNVLTPTIEKASLKRLVMANSTESYLVVDQSKFNRKALMKVNNLAEYTGVVTTKRFTPQEGVLAKRLGVNVIVVGTTEEAR